MKKYEAIAGSNEELKIEVFYDKGGMNYFTSKVDPRGYWLSVKKVEREVVDGRVVVEKFALMSGGRRMFIMEVKKQSQKSYDTAVQLAAEHVDHLKQVVLGN